MTTDPAKDKADGFSLQDSPCALPVCPQGGGRWARMEAEVPSGRTNLGYLAGPSFHF